MRYTMVFAFTPDLDNILLLRKPDSHPNPLFRGRWTVPGGKIEINEADQYGAIREFAEETHVAISSFSLRHVATFPCNCDPSEPEHEIVVYATTIIESQLVKAKGDSTEPVRLFQYNDLPESLLWSTQPLLRLALARLGQPIAESASPVAQQEAATDEQKVKQVWPDAFHYRTSRKHYLVMSKPMGKVLGEGRLVAGAWADAAASLIPVQPSAPEAKGEPAAQPVVAGGAEWIREALVDLLKFCDLNPEGETDFERSVIRAREALRLSPTPTAASPKSGPHLLRTQYGQYDNCGGPGHCKFCDKTATLAEALQLDDAPDPATHDGDRKESE